MESKYFRPQLSFHWNFFWGITIERCENVFGTELENLHASFFNKIYFDFDVCDIFVAMAFYRTPRVIVFPSWRV